MTRSFRTLLAAALCAGAFACGSVLSYSSQAQEVDLDKVFRCTDGAADVVKKCRETREVIMNNCTVCHTFAPIVMQQFEPEGWDSLLHRHVTGNRVNNLNESQVKAIRDYLVVNFNPSKDPPELPQALLDTWTSY
jgi:hypothetical protein